jgi:hypothetical protein
MAQRYGGKFSPDGAGPDASTKTPPQQTFAPRAKGAARINLLYLAPAPLLFAAFGKGATGMALDLAAVAVLWFGVFTLSEGLKAQAAYDARKVARRPALPRKIIAAVLAGFGVALAAFSPASASLLDPLLFGGIAIVLHLLAFGIDPLTNKSLQGIDTFQQDRVARVVDEAEEQLHRMTSAIGRAGDRGLERRVEAFAGTARRMCRTVEEDPRDLTAARKYLVVYLKGAADATIKFADLYSRARDPQAKANYTALLDDLEQNFAAKSETLMVTDRTDLDVEIDVLRERLQREGVRTD